MLVAEAVGRTLAGLGVDTVFGVVGSGNFHVTNALVAAGSRFVAARHECGAATMADAYARTSRKVAALSLHQGCGLTNAMTGITEAAKSRTPMLVLAADTAAAAVRSNFRVDQDGLALAVGAVPERAHAPRTAVADAARAWRTAVTQRRTVVLNLPLDVQAAPFPESAPVVPPALDLRPPQPSPAVAAALAEALRRASRPVFVAGRGARVAWARASLERLADASGALLATSAVAKGMFNGNPWYLDVSGGFASPLAAELIRGADLIVGWGCALNMWTMRHGALIGPDATVVQVDLDADAIGAHRPVDLGVVGDVDQTALAVAAQLGGPADGYRSEELRQRIAREHRWRDVLFEDESGGGRIDPRTLSIALDDLLPDERVAALGDGGALMSIAELETVVRLGLPMVVVVYDDEAYGAEVHHFGPEGYPLDTVRFPPTDIASIGRGFGCKGVTVRAKGDLEAVADWVKGPRDKPLVVDAKVVSERGSWWLEEAFRGH